MRRRCAAPVCLGALLALGFDAGAGAQSPPAGGPGAAAKDAAVILIFDASKSMRDDDGNGRPKIEAAKEGLNKLVDELPDDAKVGLRVYGSQGCGSGKAEGCKDTKLVTPVGPLDRAALKQQIGALQPKGFTPIGNSLRAAVGDLVAAKQKTIVLVSDGGDNCAPPAPCGVAKEISQQGVALKIQAVGFQVKPGARRQLECIADAGGGRYVDAGDAEELGSQLRSLTARALRPYTLQGKRLPGAPAPPQARLVAGGQYTSEVTADAVGWYAFRVGEGQGIDVSVTLPNSPAGVPSVLKTELQDERLGYADSDSTAGSGSTSETLTATSTDSEITDDELINPPAGRYFLRVEAEAGDGQSGPYPIEVNARITGTAPPVVSEQDGEGSSSSSPLPDAGGAGGSGPSDLVLLLGSLAAIAVGLGLGAALGGSRRREAT